MELANTIQRDPKFRATVQVMEASPDLQSDENCASSRDGFLLTEALRTAQQTPDIRADKVATLKARIASGEYEIDVKALARALILEDGAIFDI